MEHLAREIVDHICQYTPPVSSANLLRALNLQPRESQKQHIALWSAIFKTDKWLLEIINDIGAKPVLLGQLDKISFQDRNVGTEKPYIVLYSGDYSGDVKFTKENFYKCLQPDQHYAWPNQLEFKWGILNIADPLYQTGQTRLSGDNLRRLFVLNGDVRSQASFYDSHGIENIPPHDIIRREGFVYELNGCVLTLFRGGKCFQEWFTTHNSQLHAIEWDPAHRISKVCPGDHSFKDCPFRN
jgi:hypothetical protein